MTNRPSKKNIQQLQAVYAAVWLMILLAGFANSSKAQCNSPVTVTDYIHAGKQCYLVKNCYFGLVIPKSGTSAERMDPDCAGYPNRSTFLAPIQAVAYIVDTTVSVSDASLNFIEEVEDDNGEINSCDLSFIRIYNRATTVTLESDINGIKKATISVHYEAKRGIRQFTHDNGEENGFYDCVIVVLRGEKSAIIEETTNINFSYKVKLTDNGHPYTNAKYRGYSADYLSAGYSIPENTSAPLPDNQLIAPPSGSHPKPYDNNGGILETGREATVNLRFAVAQFPNETNPPASGGNNYPKTSIIPHPPKTWHYKKLAHWDNQPINTGWYWQLFNKHETDNPQTVGIFHGKPSRLIGGVCGGVNVFTTENQEVGLRLNFYKRPDGNVPGTYYTPRIRFSWCLYVGNKSVDIKNVNEIPPIQLAFNRFSGLADKITEYESLADRTNPNVDFKPVAGFYTGAIYQDANVISQTITKVKQSPAFRQKIEGFAGSKNKRIIDAWAAPATAVPPLLYQLKTRYNMAMHWLREGQGIYSRGGEVGTGSNLVGIETSYYFRATDWFRNDIIAISALFADSECAAIIDAAGERANLEKIVRVYARISCDDDFTPFAKWPKADFDSEDEDHGVNYNLLNMIYAFNGGRDFAVLLFKDNPEVQTLFAKVDENCKKVLNDVVNDCGASAFSPHYTEPTFSIAFPVFLQLKMLSTINNQGLNYFNASHPVNKRIGGVGDFFTNLLTPHSVRFNNNRKLVSLGHGTEESSALFAILSTGFSGLNNALSRQFRYLYENGPARGIQGNFSPYLYDFTQDPASLEDEPIIKSGQYSGYLSHLRAGIKPIPNSSVKDTKNETAIWSINGNFYRDHRNDDMGEAAIYSLGAPLSLPSLFYVQGFEPSAASQKFMVVPESEYTTNYQAEDQMNGAWNGPNQKIRSASSSPAAWTHGNSTRFANLYHGGSFSNMMTLKERVPPANQVMDIRNWERTLTLLNLDERFPVILVKDKLNNLLAGSDPNYIWGMPMASEGPVQVFKGNDIAATPPSVTPNLQIDTKNRTNCTNTRAYPTALSANNTLNGGDISDHEVYTFKFTGQTWMHYDDPSPAPGITNRGIDWKVISVTPASLLSGREYVITAWGSIFPGDAELSEFLNYNTDKNNPVCSTATGERFVEAQQNLKIKGKGEFYNIILPHRKTQQPNWLYQSLGANGFRLTGNYNDNGTPMPMTIAVNGSHVAMEKPGKKVLLSFDNTQYDYTDWNVGMSGGEAEMVIEENAIKIYIHGAAGDRYFKLPSCHFALTNNDGTASYNSTTGLWKISYAGTGPCVSPTAGNADYKIYTFSFPACLCHQ